MKKRGERIIFYSTEDMTVWYELKKIEALLETVNTHDTFNLNDFLEFYSINKYFEKKIYLKSWSTELRKKYRSISQELLKKTSLFFNTVDSDFIVKNLETIEFHYTELFWGLFNKFKIYEKIDEEYLIKLLVNSPYLIETLLQYKDIVNHYENVIKKFLLTYEWTTLLFLDQFGNSKLYFPETLSNIEKENIVLNYIENSWEDTMYKLKHISQLKNSNFLKISNKTKYLAQKKYDKSIENFFEWNTNAQKIGYTVWLSETQENDVLIEAKTPLEPKFTYSIKLFNNLYENDGVSYLFRSIFTFLDNRWNIELTNKESERSGIMELFASNAPWEYKTWAQFDFKEAISMLNIVTLIGYLNNFQGKKAYFIIDYFIWNLTAYDWCEKIVFRTHSLDKIEDYADIIKLIIPEFDLLIKQFTCYINEGDIDFELIWYQDGVSYKDIPSLLEKKYFYETNEKFKVIKHNFFSDQSSLFYIDWFERKYNNFYDLIRKEDLGFDSFHEHQIKTLKFLIEQEILYINEDSYIKIKDVTFIFLVSEIFKKWVISYNWYSEKIQLEVIEMEKQWYLYSESTLLSHDESSYFNYYLNDKEFSNSHWIRNKNLHWFSYKDESGAYNDFIIIMRLIILIFLKIEDELHIKDKDK